MNHEYATFDLQSPSCIQQDVNNNGRVNLNPEANENGTPFFIQEQVMQDDKTNYFNAMKHTLTDNPFIAFFSVKKTLILFKMQFVQAYMNIQNEHMLLIGKITDTLKVIKRSIYLQYSKHQNNNITQQVEELNKKVVDYCVLKYIVKLLVI